MPKTVWMRLATSPSLTAWISGMPPATAASKAGVGRHRELREIEPLARAGEIGVGDRGEGEPAPGTLLEHRTARLEDLDDPRADRAEAEQSNPDFLHLTGHLTGPRRGRNGRSAGEVLEPAERLLDPLLVLDQREPYEALAVLAEPDARR